MSRSMLESRPRAWPRVVVLALVGFVAAGCSDSARFNSSSYNADRPAPPQNVSSIPAPPAPTRVEAQPLPAPSQPATVSATPGTLRHTQSRASIARPKYSDVTGSVAAPSAPSGHWAWNGGSAVTVGYGETIDTSRARSRTCFGAHADQRHPRCEPDQARSTSRYSALRNRPTRH